MTERVDGTELSPDVIFNVLMNRRRRYVLQYLKAESPMELGRLAERIAAREHDVSVDEVTSKQRKSVYTSLYQSHLPKLAEAGIVDYDQDRGVVSLNHRADELEAFLDPDRRSEDRWSRLYLALSFLSAALLAVHELLFPSTMPTLAVIALIILLFTGLTGLYMHTRR